MAATPYPIPRETRESAILVGNGTTGPYGPSAFKVFDAADVDVLVLEEDSTRWEPADCLVTKSNALALDTVDVTFTTAVAETTHFVLVARRRHERAVSVFKGGAISAPELEAELSRIATTLLELRRDTDRSLRLPPGATGTGELPTLEPGLTLVWSEVFGGFVPGPQAGNIAEAQEFAERAEAAAVQASAHEDGAQLALANLGKLYLGAKASDPTLDNEGGALTNGTTYWNSTLDRLKVYSGGAWKDQSNAVGWVTETFTGDGIVESVTLSEDPGTPNNVFIWIDGEFQTDWTLTGLVVDFGEPIPDGAEVFVRYGPAQDPSALSASAAKDAAEAAQAAAEAAQALAEAAVTDATAQVGLAEAQATAAASTALEAAGYATTASAHKTDAEGFATAAEASADAAAASALEAAGWAGAPADDSVDEDTINDAAVDAIRAKIGAARNRPGRYVDLAYIPTGEDDVLFCDGSAVSRSTYALLFAKIGTWYGAGDGSTTFNLPDLRGYFRRGFSDSSSTDPDKASRTDRGDGTSGNVVGSKQADQVKQHNHAPASSYGFVVANGAVTRVSVPSGTGETGINGTITLSAQIATGNAGGNESRPKNIAVYTCITTGL